MQKGDVDLANAMVWIPDSKTPNGIAEVPLTSLAVDAFTDQLAIVGPGPFLFPSDKNKSGHQVGIKEGMEQNASRSEDPVLPDLRSEIHLRNPPKRRRRGR